MPVIQINTPNLVAEEAEIFSIISTIGANAPTTFDTSINPCFKLKPTQDCGALILEDFTDYQELSVVDLNGLTITISYGIKTDCGCDFICTGISFLPNTSYVIQNLIPDGVYGFSIQIDYVTTSVSGPVTYSKTIMQSYEKDCCTREYELIGKNIWGRMTCIACDIVNLRKVGRKTKSLNDSYKKLSNLLWLYYNSKDACAEKEQVLCMYNKIK